MATTAVKALPIILLRQHAVRMALHARPGRFFACTDKTEQECFDRMLFGAGKPHGDGVLQIKRGDFLFLINMDSDTLKGPYIAESGGAKDLVPDAWRGKYPYQVRISKNGEVHEISNAKKILAQAGIGPHDSLDADSALQFSRYLENPDAKLELALVANPKPRLESTTLWDYPKQSYGSTPKGSNKYAGVTPAFVIYNMIKRYTEPGDLVLDPMAGSGTTLDVCKEEGRKCIAYDVSPVRPEVKQNDARKLPLDDATIDMIFIDSPYGDNIAYNDHPQNIGRISAESPEFYSELEKVMSECHRVLKPGKVIGWLIGDQWVKKKFTPVGFHVYNSLCKYFEPVDLIAVARRSQTSNTGVWHGRALRFNFYLRGFKYLFIMRKRADDTVSDEKRKVSWKQYDR